VLVGVITFDFSKPSVLFGIEDILPAGVELINFDYATEDRTLINQVARIEAEKKRANSLDVQEFMNSQTFKNMEEIVVYQSEKFAPKVSAKAFSKRYRPSFEELHDDRVFLFSERINPGRYSYEYFVRVLTPGEFSHMPATVSELYNPVFFGRTESRTFTVNP
jgi:uncharacterized protein YfaS (alpha-2-macroglobulin family)